MRRYSRTWWFVMLLTSVIVGGTAFLLIHYFTSWDSLTLVLGVTVLTIVLDLMMAVSMEAIAPTRVDIGPGEKYLHTDVPAETATVVSGFDASPHGQVSVRGETWRAIRAPEDSSILPTGTAVQVVKRKGLTLVVSAESS